MTAKRSEYEHWLEVCRSYATTGGRFKVASLGGDGQDASFEQSFSNLAHAYLKNIAPTLLDHELGFQLLDRNEENTKAVGVFAFKVGSQYLFAPVFFLRGQLKGHELLYLKGQDMFVPLKENWVSYIMNRKPVSMGTGVNRQLGKLGVLPPGLSILSRSPSQKYASWVRPEIQPFLKPFAEMVTSDLRTERNALASHCREKLSLPVFLKQAGLAQLGCLVDTFRRKPAVAAAFSQFYPLSVVADSIKIAKDQTGPRSILDMPLPEAKYRAKVSADSVLDNEDEEPPKVRVVYLDTVTASGELEFMDDEDKTKLLTDRAVIQDDRDDDQVSKPVTADTRRQMFNPTETGLYMVLVKPGAFRKSFVGIAPHGPDGRKDFAVLISTDGDKKQWVNAHPSQIWCAQRIEGKDYDSWFEGLGKGDSLSDDNYYTIVGPRGEASLVFNIEYKMEEAKDGQAYAVNFQDWCDYPLRRTNVPISFYQEEDYSQWRDGARIHLDSRAGTRLRSNRGDVYVPTGFKVLHLAKKPKFDPDAPPQPMRLGSDGSDPEKPLRPGSLVDAELSIMSKTAGLKIIAAGTDFSVNNGPHMTELAAVVHLVREHGLREKTARGLLKTAQVQRSLRVRVKYANPYLTPGQNHSPAMPELGQNGDNPMGFNGPTTSGEDVTIPIDGLSSQNYDTSGYNVNPANDRRPMDTSAVQQAAATGQKEIFDTAMISSLLRTSRDENMIDQYLPTLMKAVDGVARILFQFYWHGDDFAERYGKSDMPELEDTLRNTLESLGDCTLFLKQKSVDAYPEDDILGTSLQDAANN